MKKKKIKKWMPLFVLVALIAAAYVFGLHNAVNLEQIQQHKEGLRAYAADHPLLSAGGFAASYIVSVALSLPIASLLTLLGGFLFGKWTGTLIVVTSATIGAAIIFIIAKTTLGNALREKVGGAGGKASYKKVEANMKENAAGYLLFMRLVPLFPFWFVNIVPALVNVKLRVFVLTTFIGIIPGTFIYVNVGEELGNIDSLKDIVSRDMIIAFILLGFLALVPTVYKQLKRKKHGG